MNTVTDEESSGAGGLAAVRHGVRADAGIVPEPTAFEVWVGCRGSLTPTFTVAGRPGHAEMAQPHWRDGGAVNAIEKMGIVMDAVARLREEWRAAPTSATRTCRRATSSRSRSAAGNGRSPIPRPAG